MLLDHFQPPLSAQRSWQSFLHHWAVNVCSDVNARLPNGWWAEPQVRFGIELDVGEVEPEDGEAPVVQMPAIDAGLLATPTGSVPIALANQVVSVSVLNRSYDPALMGAIEFVCPASKECPDARDTFTGRCSAALAEAAGLIVVDIVTGRPASLHAALMRRVRRRVQAASGDLYAIAYHARRSKEPNHANVQFWEYPLEIGEPLPVLPLFLRVGPMLAVDLQATYLRACLGLRIRAAETIVAANL